MASTSQEITALRTEVANLNTRLLSVTPNQIVPVVVGEFINFGCKVTEGVDNTDFIVLLEGQAAGDSANLNPKLSATPSRGFEFPNIASTIGGMFATNDVTATVSGAPATGTARYDIGFVFAGKEGAGFSIQAGTPSVATKTDFDTNGLDTSPFGEATITDPTLPIGALAVARIYVEDVFTGIQDARIADIRDFISTLFSNVVTPPLSSTDNALARFDGITGNVIQNSGVILDDSDNMSGIGTISTTGDITTNGSITLSGSGKDITLSGGGNVELNNSVAIRGKDTGGSGRNLIQIDAIDDTIIGGKATNNAIRIDSLVTGTKFTINSNNVIIAGDVDPAVTETQDIGSATFEWDNIFLQNAPTVSDSRRKNLIGPIEDASAFLDKQNPVLFSRKNRVVKEAIPEKTGQRQKFKIVQEPRIKIIDGIPTREVVEVKKLLFKSVQVVDTQGQKVTETIPAIKNEKGEVIEPERIENFMFDIPDLEDYIIPAEPEIVTTHSRPHSGFIAQEVKQAMTDAGMSDWAGYAYYESEDVHVLRLLEYIAYLVKGHQELSERIKTLESG